MINDLLVQPLFVGKITKNHVDMAVMAGDGKRAGELEDNLETSSFKRRRSKSTCSKLTLLLRVNRW